MKEIRNLLKEREKYLCELKSEKEKDLKTALEGLLRVCNSRNRIQYYHRTEPKDFNGVYTSTIQYYSALKRNEF